VIIRGLSICIAVWVVVFSAQGYFRSIRVTADNLSKVVDDEGFADWSGRFDEPKGEEARTRERRVRRVAASLNMLEFSEDAKVRQTALKERFYARLSANEQALFLSLIIEQMEPLIAAFDNLTQERRERFIKRALKEMEHEFPPEHLAEYRILQNEKLQDQIIRLGWRDSMEGKRPDDILEYLQLMEIAGELLQRIRVPKWEGRDRDE
jgi:hypothetical protein